MINLDENEILIRCACHSSEHIAFLKYEKFEFRGNNLKGENDDWYLSVSLSQFPLWKRVRTALRYVFAPRSIPYGMYAEIVMTNDDARKVAEFINERVTTS